MSEALPISVSLLPVVHQRSPHYKKMRIPGDVLLIEDHTMQGDLIDTNDFPSLPIESIPRVASVRLLDQLIELPEIAQDSKAHVVVYPYLTTRIITDKDERHIFRTDILVSPEFPETIQLFGRSVVKLSSHAAVAHLADPDVKHWLNIALFDPYVSVVVDYTTPNADYAIKVKPRDAMRGNIKRRLRGAHIGV